MSDCAKAYLEALTNPFGPFEELPCIPDTITVPSYKYSARCTGTFQCGTAGVGWVVYDPWAMIWSDPTSDTAASTMNWPILSTDNTYTGNSYNWQYNYDATPPYTVGVNLSKSDSSYTYGSLTGASVTQANQIRLVGAGLRIRYTGTTLNQGGRAVLYRDRGNNSIVSSTQSTMSSFLKDKSYASSTTSRSWKEITYLPDNPQLLGYQDYRVFDGNNVTYDDEGNILTRTGYNHFCMIAFVDGAQPSNSFEFEAIAHFELIGTNLPSSSKSPADPVGFAAVTSSVPTVIPEGSNSLYNTVMQGITSAITTMTPVVMQTLATGSGIYLAGRGYQPRRLRQRV
jgi:hypothetical protein